MTGSILLSCLTLFLDSCFPLSDKGVPLAIPGLNDSFKVFGKKELDPLFKG